MGDVIDQALDMKNICWHWEVIGISPILQGQTLATDTVIFGSKIPYKYITKTNGCISINTVAFIIQEINENLRHFHWYPLASIHYDVRRHTTVSCKLKYRDFE